MAQKNKQHTVHAACERSAESHLEKETGAKWCEKSSLVPSFVYDFIFVTHLLYLNFSLICAFDACDRIYFFM